MNTFISVQWLVRSVVMRSLTPYRYLHVRILLYRPALSKLVAAQDSSQQRREGSTLASSLRLQASVLCVQAAIDAIEHIRSRLPASVSAIGSLPAWWYNVLYIYTAATVLLAAIRCPPLKEHVHSERILESWRGAVVILRRYRAFSSSVRKSITALEMLFDQITPRDLGSNNRLNGSAHPTAPAVGVAQPSYKGVDQRIDYTPPAFSTTSHPSVASSTLEVTSDPDPGMRYQDGQPPVEAKFPNTGDSLDQIWSQENFDIAFDISDLSWLNSLPHNL